MNENKFNNYRIPAGLLITFLEKALNLIHMETHLNDVGRLPLYYRQNEEMKICQTPFTLLSPHYCEVTAVAKESTLSEIDRLLEMESQMAQSKVIKSEYPMRSFSISFILLIFIQGSMYA